MVYSRGSNPLPGTTFNLKQKNMKTKDNKVFEGKEELISYLATAIAEGFCEGENAGIGDQLKAWAYLIRTGRCWTLQGWFGRTATELIEFGIISKEGIIDWEAAENNF